MNIKNSEIPELITDTETFLALDGQARSMFDLEKRLPSQVFQRAMGSYIAFEYGWLWGNDFAKVLSTVAHCFGDKMVYYRALDPQPESYFEKHGWFGTASFQTADLKTRYSDIMGGRGAAFLFTAGVNICALWGSSLAWGIVCDRISWELCVMGIAGDKDFAILSKIRSLDSKTVDRYIAAAYHWKPETAKEFSREFHRNYELKSW